VHADTVQVIHAVYVCMCTAKEAADSSTVTPLVRQCCKL